MGYHKSNDYFMNKFNRDCIIREEEMEQKKMERTNRLIFWGFGSALLVMVIFKVIELL